MANSVPDKNPNEESMEGTASFASSIAAIRSDSRQKPLSSGKQVKRSAIGIKNVPAAAEKPQASDTSEDYDFS